MGFSDHFSSLAGQYAEFRPSYPDALFVWLAEVAQARKLVWDCGSGGGQASRGLAKHFRSVIATDASRKQIAAAPAHRRITYRVAEVEGLNLDTHSVDMVTAAQAVHWFKLNRFYKKVRHVTKPGGVIAFWCYQFFSLPEQPVIMERVERFKDKVRPYWPPERAYTDAGYRNLPFPFTQEIKSPKFQIEESLDLPHFLGYLRSWSATDLFKKANAGIDPVVDLERELGPLWGRPDEPHKITFPICMRVARL